MPWLTPYFFLNNSWRRCAPGLALSAGRNSLDDFIAACQRPLRRSIRVNTLKISVEDFLTLVSPPTAGSLRRFRGVEEGFWIERDDEDAVPLGSTAEHLSGLFYIQEASSMLPVAALFADGNAPDARQVMDVAAAPGSKTTQIAARMGNRGAILANEFSASRVKVLHANISRCGIQQCGSDAFRRTRLWRRPAGNV